MGAANSAKRIMTLSGVRVEGPRGCYYHPMCRSIKQLRKRNEIATDEEVIAAALQFVRKISGYRQPSGKNEAAFGSAVDEIAFASRRLLEEITK